MTTIEYGHTEPVEVHFDDLDAMGVVHNGRYVVLLERALSAYWTRRGWPFDPGSPRFAEIFFVVREFSIRFLQPIMGVGPVQIHFWIDRLGTSTVDYCFRVKSFDGAVVYAEGRRAQTKVDRQTLRPSPVSSAVREACAPLLSLGATKRIAS